MENASGVVDSPQENVSVENVSTDDLRSLLNQTTEAPQEIVESQPEEAEALETEPQAVDAPEETPEDVPLPENQEDGEDRLAKRRIRPKSDLDQQVIDLYRSEGFSGSFADASRIIYGQSEPYSKPQVEAETPNEPSYAVKVDNYIDGVNKEIQELNQKVSEAAENMDTVEAIKLQQEIMDRRLNIQKAESRKEIFLERERSKVPKDKSLRRVGQKL
jgi:hypothetical protein